MFARAKGERRGTKGDRGIRAQLRQETPVFEPIEARVLMSASVPAGAETLVNQYTTDQQNSPAIASDLNGNFVAVWMSNGQDGSGYGVYARRFAADGTPLAGEFRVNSYTAGDQRDPSVTVDAGGNFVVAWASDGQDGSGRGIYARRFDAAGNALPSPYGSTGAGGGEFRVNSTTAGAQAMPDVATDDAGNFIVAWTSDQDPKAKGERTASEGIYAQRFDAAGNRRGVEFGVNTYTRSRQFFATVACDADGDAIVSWMSSDQDGSGFGVYAQRLDKSGANAGAEFRVNQTTVQHQYYPDATMDAAGNFAVAWETGVYDSALTSPGGDYYNAYARRYAADGTALSGEFLLGAATTGRQAAPAVSMDHAGNLTAVWVSNHASADGTYDVYVRQFDAAGNPLDAEARVNTATTGQQVAPAVASQQGGRFVVTYVTADSQYVGADVYFQRYEPPVPSPFGTTAIADPLPSLSPADPILGLDQPLLA